MHEGSSTDVENVSPAGAAAPVSDKVPCHVCQREIPASAAASSEATDYVAYFCGLECYDQWRHRP